MPVLTPVHCNRGDSVRCDCLPAPPRPATQIQTALARQILSQMLASQALVDALVLRGCDNCRDAYA